MTWVWTFDPAANKGTSVACGYVIFNAAGNTFDAEINEFSSVVDIRELEERFVVFVLEEKVTLTGLT
jgi:lipoprotein signal peptidase